MLYRHEAKPKIHPAHQMGKSKVRVWYQTEKGVDSMFFFGCPWSVERVCLQFEDGKHISSISILPKDRFQYHVLCSICKQLQIYHFLLSYHILCINTLQQILSHSTHLFDVHDL